MKNSNFTETQILAIVAEAESGRKIYDFCREHRFTQATCLQKCSSFIVSRFTNSVHKLKNFIFGEENYVPFIVLSTARTGSNLLRSYLNNHPDIHVEGEILKKINNRDSQKIIDNCWGPQPKHFKAIGFKLFYGHPFDESDKNSWKPILEKQNLHIIHLKRHNAIRSFISERIAFNNGEWLNNNPGHTVNKDPIHYNPKN
jgi:hypothetical protein